jgi:hypothetical protein
MEEAKSRERKRKREAETKRVEEEIARKQLEAMAENAARTLALEEEAEKERSMNLQASFVQNMEQEKETNVEMVWHPTLRELVPLTSISSLSDDWRDKR